MIFPLIRCKQKHFNQNHNYVPIRNFSEITIYKIKRLFKKQNTKTSWVWSQVSQKNPDAYPKAIYNPPAHYKLSPFIRSTSNIPVIASQKLHMCADDERSITFSNINVTVHSDVNQNTHNSRNTQFYTSTL